MSDYLSLARKALCAAEEEYNVFKEQVSSGEFEAEITKFCATFRKLAIEESSIARIRERCRQTAVFACGINLAAMLPGPTTTIAGETRADDCPGLTTLASKASDVRLQALLSAHQIFANAEQELTGIRDEYLAECERLRQECETRHLRLRDDMAELQKHRLSSSLLAENYSVWNRPGQLPHGFRLVASQNATEEFEKALSARVKTAKQAVVDLETIRNGVDSYQVAIQLAPGPSTNPEMFTRVYDVPHCCAYLYERLKAKKYKTIPRELQSALKEEAFSCRKPSKEVLEWLRKNTEASDPWAGMLKKLDGPTRSIGIGAKSRSDVASVFTGNLDGFPDQERLMRCAYETCLLRCLEKPDEAKKESKAKRSRAD